MDLLNILSAIFIFLKKKDTFASNKSTSKKKFHSHFSSFLLFSYLKKCDGIKIVRRTSSER